MYQNTSSLSSNVFFKTKALHCERLCLGGTHRLRGSQIIVPSQWKICLCWNKSQSTAKGGSVQFILPWACPLDYDVFFIHFKIYSAPAYLMIWPSFYWNPHSACRLFKCQQLMGEWISDANSRMLISFARMNILFRHQGRAFPWITWKTLEKYFWNTDQLVSFQANRSMMCGRKTLVVGGFIL